MKISYSQRRGQANITEFDGVININSFEALKEVAKFDHVLAELGEWTDEKTGRKEFHHRADKCFICADVIGMDVDNSHSDNPADWFTPEILFQKLPRVKFAFIYSRNHMKEKDGKAPRPKFHLYFPLSRELKSAKEATGLKNKLMNCLPNIFDEACKDATRLFFGVENPDGGEINGKICIDDFLQNIGKTKESRATIPQGERNSKLYNYAVGYLMNFTLETALKKYDAKAAICEPPLERAEIEKIFSSAQKSDLVRARYLASDKIKESGDDLQHARNEFELEVQQITTDAKIISEAWKTAIKLIQKNIKEPRQSSRIEKIPLTSRHVENLLKENNITLRLNVVTQEYEVIGLPEDSEYTPEFYANLHEADKKRMGTLIIIDFLTPALKDRNYSFSEKNLKNIVTNIFLAHEYNPVAEMMRATAWDGEDRISKLCGILGIESNPLYCTYLKKWLIQGAAMAFNDKGRPYGNEFVLVLQGAQGIGKTSFFEVLALRPEWFNSGVIVDVFNKDSLIQLDQAFINEIGEYDQTQKKEQSALREVISRPISKYRLPYGESHISRIRRCIFGATVNAERFIMNADGGTRRDAVIKLTKDFHAEIRELSDDWIIQLWAQAFSLYCANTKGFRLTYEERQKQERLNADVVALLPGEQELDEWLDWSKPVDEWNLTTASQIIELTGLRTLTARKLGRALTRVAQRDKRVIIKRDRIRGTLYLLPPVLQLSNINAYGDIDDIDFSEKAESVSVGKVDVVNETNDLTVIKIHNELFNSYKKNRVKTDFQAFVRSFGTDTLSDLKGEEITYQEAEKLRADIIAYHERRIAA